MVLNSLSAIKDLFEIRSEIYSDRPTIPALEMSACYPPPSFKADSSHRLNLDWPISMIRKGETWREGRRLLDRSLRPSATITYQYMMEEKTHMFLATLLTTPEDFRHHIKL